MLHNIRSLQIVHVCPTSTTQPRTAFCAQMCGLRGFAHPEISDSPLQSFYGVTLGLGTLPGGRTSAVSLCLSSAVLVLAIEARQALWCCEGLAGGVICGAACGTFIVSIHSRRICSTTHTQLCIAEHYTNDDERRLAYSSSHSIAGDDSRRSRQRSEFSSALYWLKANDGHSRPMSAS